MDKPRLWEQVRKCELLAQKLALDLKILLAEVKSLEEMSDEADHEKTETI